MWKKILIKRRDLLPILLSDCGYEKETYTSKTIEKETPEKGMKTFEVNMRAVYAMRTVGLDHTDLDKLCCMMNLPKAII